VRDPGELERVAFGPAPPGPPPALDPDGDLAPRERWLAGVCLGALGRYAEAARFLLPGGVPAGSLAASCAASHLRQVGRHAEAEPLDRHALALAATAEECADALVGLVADAVGALDLAAARRRLRTAEEAISGDVAWRPQVRLAWVRAEVALLGDDPLAAVSWARMAGRLSREVSAWRHAVKSDLILGAALEAAGRRRAAARVLGGVAARADRSGLVPLVWPARTLRSRIIADRAPTTAARERQRATCAESIIELPSEGANRR
jgi:hypothetical protein